MLILTNLFISRKLESSLHSDWKLVWNGDVALTDDICPLTFLILSWFDKLLEWKKRYLIIFLKKKD